MALHIGATCTSCAICEPLCPTKSIFKGVGQYVIDADTCGECEVCYQVCPESAIHRSGDKEDAKSKA
jgi:ferredoxin